MVMNDCNNDYNMMINQTKYKTDSNKVIRNTGDDIGKDSSSHITKNISVTGIDEALAHAIFTSDVGTSSSLPLRRILACGGTRLNSACKASVVPLRDFISIQ